MPDNGKNILVTGGAGFIGSHLVDALINQGHHVVVLDNFSTGKRERINAQARVFEADIRDFKNIKPIFNGVDCVFHLAAQPSVQFSIDYPVESNENNLAGTLNVLVAASQMGAKKVIYSASSAAYGDQENMPLIETLAANPQNPYALQKHAGEIYCRLFSKLHNLPTVCLRYFNVYGPRQSAESAYAGVVGAFIQQILSGQPMAIVGDGQQSRDFIYVGDVVRANILAMQDDQLGGGEIINVGSEAATTINELAQTVLNIASELNISTTAESIIHVVSRVGDVRQSLANISKARHLLKWEPNTELKEGLKNTFKYFLSQKQ